MQHSHSETGNSKHKSAFPSPYDGNIMKHGISGSHIWENLIIPTSAVIRCDKINGQGNDH